MKSVKLEHDRLMGLGGLFFGGGAAWGRGCWLLRHCPGMAGWVGLLAVIFFGGSALSATHDWSAEPLRAVKINTVAYRGWVPDTTETLSGVLVLIPGRHGDGRRLADQARWRQLASDVGFGILACQFADGDSGLYQSDEIGEVAGAINAAVRELAKLSGKPELADAPLAFWGTSAGSNVSSRYCNFFPGRVAAFGSSKGTWGPGEGGDARFFEIPMIFAIGANDNPEWVKASLDRIGRGLGNAPWTLALHPGEGHSVGDSLDAIIPFLASAINQRLGRAAPSASHGGGIFQTAPPKFGSLSPPSKTVKSLKKISLRDGWLGHPETFEVAAHSDFRGAKSKAIWLPDEAAALAWQGYLKK